MRTTKPRPADLSVRVLVRRARGLRPGARADQAGLPYRDPGLSIDRRVEDLLGADDARGKVPSAVHGRGRSRRGPGSLEGRHLRASGPERRGRPGHGREAQRHPEILRRGDEARDPDRPLRGGPPRPCRPGRDRFPPGDRAGRDLGRRSHGRGRRRRRRGDAKPRHPPGPVAGHQHRPRRPVGPGRGNVRRGPVPGIAAGRRLRPGLRGARRRRDAQAFRRQRRRRRPGQLSRRRRRTATCARSTFRLFSRRSGKAGRGRS